MMRTLAVSWSVGVLASAFLATAALAVADLRPEKVHVADAKKTQKYLRDGLVTGGDKSVDEVVVRDIRRSVNATYERVVIDLEGNMNGEPMAIPRPPYYQVSVSPDEKRVMFTVFGKPKLALNTKRVTQSFHNSPVVKDIILYPAMEKDNWSFVVELKEKHPVEIFELGEPARVIMDIRTR